MRASNSGSGVVAGWGALLAVSVVMACAKGAPPPAPERSVLVAQPCAGLELGAEPLDPANARVFVEVAEVGTRDLPNPIGRWLEENIVRVRSSANLVAFPDVPTSMPWGQCVDAVCSSTRLSLTVAARLPERASEPIELALRIDETASADAAESGPRVLLDTLLRARNQEPVVLPPAPQISDGSVVVTPYLLRRHDDLQRILECREQQREREKSAS